MKIVTAALLVIGLTIGAHTAPASAAGATRKPVRQHRVCLSMLCRRPTCVKCLDGLPSLIAEWKTIYAP